MLKAYHTELVNAFRLLNHKVNNMPSFEELKAEFYNKYAVCLPVATVVLPIVLSESGIDIDEALQKPTQGTEKQTLLNKAYSDTMKYLLPELESRDVI